MSRLFAAIDADGVRGMWNDLADDVLFRFGSFPEGRGRGQFAAVWGRMAPAIAGLHHELLEAWEIGDTSICRGMVRYERHDGTAVTVPFANIFKRRDRLIHEYRIYVDASAVFGLPPT